MHLNLSGVHCQLIKVQEGQGVRIFQAHKWELEAFGFSHESNVQSKVAVRFWTLKIWTGRRLDGKTLLLKDGGGGKVFSIAQ